MVHTTRAHRLFGGIVLGLALALTAGCTAAESGPGATTASDGAPTEDVGVLSDRPLVEVTPARPYDVFLLTALQLNPWTSSVATAAEDYAKEVGINLTVLDAGGYGNIQKQISQIEAATAQSPDAIMIYTTDPAAVTPAVQKAQDAGIKIVNFISPSEVDAPTITGDYVAEGKQMMDALAKKIGEKGNIMVVLGGAGGFYATALQQGIDESLKSLPDVKVAKNVTLPDFDSAKTQEAVRTFLTGNPDTKGVLATSGVMGVGAVSGVAEAGLTGQVAVAASLVEDCTTLDLIKSGEFPVLLGDPAVYGAQVGIQTVVQYLNGEEVPDVQIPATNIYTTENIQEAIDSGAIAQEVDPSYLDGCL